MDLDLDRDDRALRVADLDLDLDRDDRALRVADLDGRVCDAELADVCLEAGEHRDGGGVLPDVDVGREEGLSACMPVWTDEEG